MGGGDCQARGGGGRGCGFGISNGKDGKSVGWVTGFTGLVLRTSEFFFPFRAIGGRGIMFSSATGTLRSGFPVRTFPGIMKLGTKPAFSLKSAEGGFVSKVLAAMALCHSLSFLQVFDFYAEVKKSS